MGKIYDWQTLAPPIGRIETDGKVYDGVGMYANLIGRVDGDGSVYVAETFDEKLVGRVETDGSVYAEAHFGGGIAVGRVETSGKVYNGSGLSATYAGRAEPPHIFGGGAALLLLFIR